MVSRIGGATLGRGLGGIIDMANQITGGLKIYHHLQKHLTKTLKRWAKAAMHFNEVRAKNTSQYG